MGSNCCKGDAAGRPIKSSSSIYSRYLWLAVLIGQELRGVPWVLRPPAPPPSRAGASLDGRFAASEGAGGVRLTVSSARTGDSGVYTLQASNAAGSDTRRLRLEVSAEAGGDDPPTFLRRLQDLTVKVGTRTRFLVEIISATECKVTWYRNERRLMEAERVALVRDGNLWCADVATVSVEDAGRWTCTAENSAGRASCSAHLNVLVPKAYKRPEFVEELRALLTEQGTVSLECKVVGVPTPVLRWFKDSREIKAGDVFALTANAEDPTSLGTYTCEAVNCMGRAYSSSKVHVIGRGAKDGPQRPSSGGVTAEPPPIFTKELEDQFVKICDHLTLSCHIVVPPWPRSVVWYNKEGKIEPSERYHVIEDGVGGYLVEVGSAEWADEGEWKCVATSSGGRVGITTCHITMEVPKNFRKPRFMENLQAVLTEEGLVSFECKVVGFPTPVLSWFKDGQELKPGDVYQLTGTNSLGSYCCIARNCMGQASSSAELTVEDIQNQLNEEEKLQLFSKNQAPKFIQGLKSVEAKIDEPFRFTIKVAIPPEPSVLWYRDDQPIDESPRCRLGKEERGTFFLDIQNLEFLDQAEWKCVAMNDFGHSVTSCFLKLLIPRHYKKPRFLENLQAILSDEGAVNLECKVIGVPQPVLKWYKDGEELKPGDIHRIISGQDGTCCLGTYTCEAQNCMGIAASSASLLGFDDSVKTKNKKKTEEQSLQRNLSLSTIHEERTSQMYDTPMGDITLDDKGEISFSFDGKEVSVSLYETPDLTEEEALQIVEMYADQLSENITEHNVVELPPLRFVKETSTSGNLLMEAIIIDVSPEYFSSPEEDLRTEADIEDISIADENVPLPLSLDQDEEKIVPIVSDEKTNSPLNIKRKKSDSQKSGDDYFSLSRDQSISEEKRDDDTQLVSESDLQSFASAHSSGKPEKSTKNTEDRHEIFETKKSTDVHKLKRERRSSHGSRKSSSGSEKLKEELENEMEGTQKTKFQMKFKEDVINISSSLNNIINDIQNIEKDIILKSELMSSAATASKSLEIINSLLTPLSEIHSINDAMVESVIETKDVSDTLFVKLSQSLKSLQQSLTIIEKCIDVGNDNRTLVKKTCISLIEKCGLKLQALMGNVKSATLNNYIKIKDEVVCEIETVTNEINTIVTFTSDTIKTKNLLIEASELQSDELTFEAKYLQDTQKCIFNLKRPLISLLSIVENAEKGKLTDVVNVNNSEVILADMSASIQDLQSALEQIELLSVTETSTNLNKYNTEIINVVMNPVLELRNSFESLSTNSKPEENNNALKQKLIPVKSNLNVIFSYLNDIERNVGTFDILQSDNKLEALQIIAQILISLENNLPRLEVLPHVKKYMSLFHKHLTKALENVIESNETKKYFDLIEICDAVKRINNSIHDVDSRSELCLASINNTLQVINDCLEKNVFDFELNRSTITNISELRVCIQELLNKADDSSLHFESEHVREIPESIGEDNKVNVVVESINRTLATISSVNIVQTSQEPGNLPLPAMENIIPILEELKTKIAGCMLSGVETEEHISEMNEVSSLAEETLARPLYELNQYVSVFNEMLVENPESVKECNQQISTYAEPLNELYKTLEILQHDVISQLGDELTPSVLSLNIANSVQNLHSAILIVNDNVALEANDELSTLDDISGLKTTADTYRSEKLDMPFIEQRDIQTFTESMLEEKQVSCLEEALNKLNEHVMTLQNPEYKEELLNLLNIGSTTTFDSLTELFAETCTEIENILHTNEDNNRGNISKFVALVKPMVMLQQSLSVIDINNIPVFKHSLDVSSDSIHSVFKSISELKNHLDKCVQVIVTASELTDKTIEISQSIESLKRSCEFLANSLGTSNTMLIANILPLNPIIEMVLDATDTSKEINISEIKLLSTKLLDEVLTICDDVFTVSPQSENMQQETNLLEVLREIESAIVVLEQNHFDYASEPLHLKTYRPQIATIIETEQLNNFEEVLKSTMNIIKESNEHSDDTFEKQVESFLYTWENKLKILNYLINTPLTFKSITRLYQEFIWLLKSVREFQINMPKLNMSTEIKDCLEEYLEKANNFLEIARLSLIKIFETQNEMLFTKPLTDIKNNIEIIGKMKKKCGFSDINELTTTFLNVSQLIIPNIDNLDKELISTLSSIEYHEICNAEYKYIDEWNIFVRVIEETLSNNSLNFQNKQKIEEMLNCLQINCPINDAIGMSKKLLLLKCMSECSQILRELVINNQEPQDLVFNEKEILANLLKPVLVQLKDLSKQLNDVKDKEKLENVPLQMKSLVSYIKTAVMEHKDILLHIEAGEYEITSQDTDIILEIYNQIQSVKNNVISLNNEQVLLKKHSLTFIDDIEQSILKILPPETLQEQKHILQEKSKNLIINLQKYIGNLKVIEKILSVIQIKDVAESLNIAEELYIILTSDNMDDTKREIHFLKGISKNIERIWKLQNAIQIFYSELLEHRNEVENTLGKDDLQRATKIIEDLRVDLLAVMKMQSFETASELIYTDRTSDENIETNCLNLANENANKCLEHLSQVTTAEENIESSEIRDTSDKLVSDFKSNEPANVGDVARTFSNEIIKEDDSFLTADDPTNIFNNDATSIEATLVDDLNLQCMEIKMTERVFGKLINHIEELMSHNCAEVITKVCELSSEPNVGKIIKFAEEIKKSITTDITEPENQLFNTLNIDNFMENNANLLSELQHAVSAIQTVIQEESQELPADLNTIDLQYAKDILTNLFSDLNLLNSIGSEAEHSSIEEKAGELYIHDSVSLHVCEGSTSDDVIKEAFETSKETAISTETPIKINELLDTVDDAATNHGEHVDIFTKNFEKDASSAKTKTAEQVVQLENDNANTNIQASDDSHFNETKKVIPVGNIENITDSLQLASESVQEEDSMQRLKSLLQEVSDKIDTLTTVRTVDDRESLQNNLDEIQAVIIEIKRDYDGSANDTLNETLEDLECSVRSVQLQIHENSPSELLKEACATLQLLVTNMTSTQNVQVVQTASHQAKVENILKSCSDDTENTLKLLDAALNTSMDAENELNVLYGNVNELKLIIKSLKSHFNENIEILIERGIEIMQILNQAEDRVFTLEKEIELNNKLKPLQRDDLVTAVHSIYGTVSNMRSAMTSVQKQYMFENYGKSSELVLVALKNLSFIVQKIGKDWKALSKSLRKVLNHFEDIKFYINFDKTARLPSDPTFTKIILLDLKAVVTELLLTKREQFTSEILCHTEKVIQCLENNLLEIEHQSSLEVKDKIPIFKNVSLEINTLTKYIKEYLQFTENKEKMVNEKIEVMNATDENIKETESANTRTLTISTLEQTSQDVTQLNVENKTLEDVIEIPCLESDSNNESRKNIRLCHNDKDSETSIINLKQSDGKAGILIERHISNFALEVLPESIVTENVAENLILQLEELKPLEATSSQTIETRVFYKAKVTETVTEILIEDYIKLDPADIDVKLNILDDQTVKNSFLDSNKKKENLSDTTENNDSKRADPTTENLEGSSDTKQTKTDVETGQLIILTQEDTNKQKEEASVTESICASNIKKDQTSKEVHEPLQNSHEIKKEDSTAKCLAEEIDIENADIKIELPVQKTPKAEENDNDDKSDFSTTNIMNDDIENNGVSIIVEKSSPNNSESSKNNNITKHSLVIADSDLQEELVKVGQVSQNHFETEKENASEKESITDKALIEDITFEKIKPSLSINDIEDNNNNKRQVNSPEKCFPTSTDMKDLSKSDSIIEKTGQINIQTDEKNKTESKALALECHSKSTNIGQEETDINIEEASQNILLIVDETSAQMPFETLHTNKETGTTKELHSEKSECKDMLIKIDPLDDSSSNMKLPVANIETNDSGTQNVDVLPVTISANRGVQLVVDNIGFNSTKFDLRRNETEHENIFDSLKDSVTEIITDIELCEVTNLDHTYESHIQNSCHIENVTTEINEIPVISEIEILQDIIPTNLEKIDMVQNKDVTQHSDTSTTTVNLHENTQHTEPLKNEMTVTISEKNEQIENYVSETCEKCENLINLTLPNELFPNTFETEASEALNEVENISLPNLISHVSEKDRVRENINQTDFKNEQAEKTDVQYQVMYPTSNNEDIAVEETQDFIAVKSIEETIVTHDLPEYDSAKEKVVFVIHKILENTDSSVKEIDKGKDSYQEVNEENLLDRTEDLAYDQKLKMEEITILQEDPDKIQIKDESFLVENKLEKKKAEVNGNKSINESQDLEDSKDISNKEDKLTKDINNESIIKAESSQDNICDGNTELSRQSGRSYEDGEAVDQASDNIQTNGNNKQNNVFEAQNNANADVEIDKINKAKVRKNSSKRNKTKTKQKIVEEVQYDEKPDVKNEIMEASSHDEINKLKESEYYNTNRSEMNMSEAKEEDHVILESKESIQDANMNGDFGDIKGKPNLSITEKTTHYSSHEIASKKESDDHNNKNALNGKGLNLQNADFNLQEDKMEKKNDIPVTIHNISENIQMEDKSVSKEKEVKEDVKCNEVLNALEKSTEALKKEMLCNKNTNTDNGEHKLKDCHQNKNQNKTLIEEKSCQDLEKIMILELNASNDLNDHLNNLPLDLINVSEIRQIELDALNQKSCGKIFDNKDVSNKYVDDKSECKRIFIEQTKNDYENDFLKPPGYIERQLINDYPVPQQDRAQNYTFYKAQTLVSNIQFNPVPVASAKNEVLDSSSDTRMKSKGFNDNRKTLTEIRSNTLRDVKRKPVFSTYLTDRTAVEGSRVKLTCSVLTSSEPKITWYKNGAPLNDKLKYRTKFLDGLLTMEVLNAVPSDSAEYSCTVETEYGLVNTTANLKVYPSFEASPIPPTFTRSIRDFYHLAEDELVLECRIRGQQLPTITWLKDDKVLEPSERHQAYYLADGVCRLSIIKPTSEDSGKYTCKAENSMWSDEISHIVTFTGREGKIGPNLTSLEKLRLNRQSLESRRPHFANVLTDYKVARGGTIGLQVEIKGSPIRVEWLREGRSITEIYRNAQTFVDHGLYTLALPDVTETESGIYTCRAWSNHGNVDMNAAITVVKPNEIDGKPAVIIGRPQKDMLISVGEDLNISFRVQGDPKPKVTFMKGIRDITNSQRVFKMTSDDYTKFTLKRSVVSDAGTYCILARNAYGCDRAFVTVVIRQRASSENLISDWTYPTDDPAIMIDERRFKSVPNRIPGEPNVVDGGNNWLSLAWPKPDTGGGAPVQAYKIEGWLLGKEGGARWTELGITPLNSFDVFNLKQGEEYHFRITPRNRYGWGESVQTTLPIGVGIAGDRPEFVNILPGQLKVLVGETATLKCSFKGKPIPEIVWMKNGHEIDEEDMRLKTNLENYESSLTIDGVRIEDEARYSCEATNIHGRASTYARVAVVTDRLIWEADAKLKRERSADVGGDCPPQFTMRLRDRRVQATYPVRLTCQVIGRPPPVITWFKDGEEVKYDSRRTKSQDELFHTLEIAPTNLDDGGTYEAMARNSSGAISCRCNLVVDKGIRAYVAPEFCCGLEPLYQLSVGEELRMSAVVEAYPSVGVTWYRDGIRLRPSRRAVMTLDRDGQIELAVGSVTQRDAGVYTCTASNEVGKASTSGKVEVLGDVIGDRAQMLPTLVCPNVPYSKEPAFIRKPRSSEAREGDTVIIECEVIGDPKPDVYWLRDFLRPDYYRDASHFKRVGAGPEYRFEIPHAKLDYTGAYSVVAKNQYGEAKAVISLQILAKDPSSSEEAHNIRYGRVEVIPRFEKELTDLLSHDGDAVEFECRVSGNPEPDIKWYQNTESIRDCPYFETTYELGTARLKIRQVTADDEGTYTCEARNGLGKARTSACLIVYPPGEPNTLSQRLRRPPALLSGASTPRSTPARSMSRTRTPVPDMRSLSSPAREIAPKFYTYPFNKVAEEGDTVVFQCAVKGLPSPWATWDKDGVVITPSSRIAIREKDEMLRTLEIEEVNSEDVGLYRVTLENDYGRAEASARLEVISHAGKFYSGGRSYSASPRRSMSYKRSKLSLPRQD